MLFAIHDYKERAHAPADADYYPVNNVLSRAVLLDAYMINVCLDYICKQQFYADYAECLKGI